MTENKVQEFCAVYSKAHTLAREKLNITRGFYEEIGSIDTRPSSGIRFYKKAYGTDSILGYVDVLWEEIF